MERDLTVIKSVLSDMGFEPRDDRQNVWKHKMSHLVVFDIDQCINFKGYIVNRQSPTEGEIYPQYTFSQEQINDRAFVTARILKAVAQYGYTTGRNELRQELSGLLAQEVY